MSAERDDELAYRDAIAAGDDEAWEGLGRVLSAQPERAQEAEAAFRMAIGRGVVSAWNSLGWLLAGQAGREDEAEQAYRVAIATANSDAWRGLLRLLARQPGREDAAEHAFREAAAAAAARAPGDVGALRREYALALMDKGLALDAAGRHRDALEVFGDVVARFGSDEDPQIAWRVAWALVDKGLALQQLGRPGAAVVEFDAAYRRIVELPDRDEDLLARALLDKGEALFVLDRLDEAVSVCDLALEHFGETTGEDPGHRDRSARARILKATRRGRSGGRDRRL